MNEREIDATDALMSLSTRNLILFANKALNRMTMRDLGEICFELGLHPSVDFPPSSRFMPEKEEPQK